MLARLDRDAFTLVFVAVTAILVAIRSADLFAQDTWLALFGGRVVTHGLPHHDSFAVWTHGARWIDQQWLGQLLLYGLFDAGGVRLLTGAALLVIVATVVMATAAARSRGSSPVRIGLTAGVAIAVVVPDLELRTQLLVAPLFVALLRLLVRESVAPSRRAFLAIPVLALWANVHGSVLLGALLVVVWALTSALRSRPLPETGGFVALAALSIFASPYGFALADYYRRFLFNSAFAKYVTEWRPTSPEIATAPFFAALLVAFWLLGRSRALNTFERSVVVLTGIAGLAGVRNLLWFGLAALVVLPAALEEAWPVRTRERAPANVLLGTAAVVGVAVGAALAVARHPSWLQQRWPDAASAAVAKASAAYPRAIVYADLRYADWLLLERPRLRGRIAFDARLELLSRAQLRRISDVAGAAGRWKRVLSPAAAVVLDPRAQGDTIRALERDPRYRTLYRSAWISVQARR